MLFAWIALAAWASVDPEELLHLARERGRHGDYEGVRIVASQALEIDGDHQRSAQYLIAWSYEYGGDPQQALELYDALIHAYSNSKVPDDLRFRRAECLGRLGRYDEAMEELELLPAIDRPPLDQLKIDVLQSTWELEVGKERQAYKRLTTTLTQVQPDVGTYYQALARYAILSNAVEAADAIQFKGSDRKKGKALEERARLLEIGNEQLAEIIRCQETQMALDGFLKLGRAHKKLGADMLDESPLTRLTPEQLAKNRDLLRKKVERVWVKASQYYDRAIQFAARMDWTGEPVPTMKAEYEALLAEVDGL
jgi:tetratricopeptide (TPR) repeat protein